MHLLLTDRLACPRCGPEFGLILRADAMRDRRVLDGALGCPNCREKYPVSGGFGDLRPPPRGALHQAGGVGGEPVGPGEDPADEREHGTFRLGALLGIRKGPGFVALLGESAHHAGPLADLVEDLEVVAISPRARAWPDRRGVNRIASGGVLPFFSMSLRGIVLDGEGDGGMLEEAARVVAPMGRVVVLDGNEGTPARLRGSGLRVLVEEGGTVVADREGR